MCRSIFSALIAASAVGLIGSPAVASDLGNLFRTTDAYQASNNWSGFYVGLQGGTILGTNSHGNQYSYTDPWWSYSFETADIAPMSGWAAGAFAGYNMQFGKVVAGVEADYTKAKLSQSFTDSFGMLSSASMNWSASVRGRLGYDMGALLPYVTGGYEWAGWNFSSGYSGSWAGSPDQWSQTLSGLTIGPGLEYAFTKNVRARAEYRYTRFNESSHVIQAYNTTVTNKPDVHRLMVGLSYNF